MSNSTQQGNGISTLGLLGVVFVALKLGGVIDWSWWWVTLPFWAGFAFVVAFVLIGLLFAILVEATRWDRS